ncbi:MAG: phenylacetate--CoA ligase family protein [Candidatus Omnitrophota bacterium]|nr:MAG: phenylacetate--CoA ligase family protein [Candidatus Omnitrophota bacterium]
MLSWKKLSRLKKEDIKKLQDKKLRYFLRHEIPYHPHYRKLFDKLKLKFDDIKSTDDLVKLPFSSKADIAPTKADSKRPREFILQPDKELLKQYAPKSKLIKFLFNKELVYYEYKPIHMHVTTGRTALPTPFLYSGQDLERLKETGRRMFDVFGFSKEDRGVNAFPYAPHLAFWQTYYGSIASETLSLPTGGGKIMGSEAIIKAIENLKASILISMPGYAYHLARKGAEEKKDFSNLKNIVFGGERVPAGLKDKLREVLAKTKCRNPKILSTYAFTEGKGAWAECDEGSGYHLYPDLEFIEVIDKNGDRVGEGEEGEVVYTALDWRGTVVLRYKTGDISKIYYDKCSCGRTVPRLDSTIERSSEIKEFRFSKIKGTLVNLNRFFALMSGHKSIDEWQVEIKKKRNDPYGVDELILYIAPRKKVDVAKLKMELKKIVREATEVTPDIIMMDKARLLDRLGMETELKEKRIVDSRPKK